MSFERHLVLQINLKLFLFDVAEESFTQSLNTATKYSITAEFFNTGGPAQTYLSWSYTGQAKQNISSSAFSYISLTTYSPLSITVGPTWGDGYRTPSEQWDDDIVCGILNY